MLPGVELARKRRIHHHDAAIPRGGGGGLPEPSMPRPWPFESTTSMDEAALLARKRLQEKLRGFGSPANRPPCFFSWSQPAGSESAGVGGASSRGAVLPAGNEHGGGVLLLGRREKPAAAVATRRPAVREMSRSRGGSFGSDAGEELCAVCLEGFRARQQVTSLPCAHRYHADCLLPWLAARSHCPCCRAPVIVPS